MRGPSWPHDSGASGGESRIDGSLKWAVTAIVFYTLFLSSSNYRLPARPHSREATVDLPVILMAMRTLDAAKTRWGQTLEHSSSFADLQRAVKFNGSDSPCVAGCRSVCWKAFLLFKDTNAANWAHVLLEHRTTYSALREHYLKYIKHPELLTQLSLDPLADDPDSPWTASRQDELVRNEILQDVQRLPDEPAFYHLESTQTLILDILFVWVKLNPDLGGYRQGMHELLAPILHVIDQDAIDRSTVGDAAADPIMVDMLDSYFIEHDAFALFSCLMDRAKPFYQVSVGAGGPLSGEQSAIVEKSKEIHEVALMTVDPELARHLKSIEVLPQIFLMWVLLPTSLDRSHKLTIESSTDVGSVSCLAGNFHLNNFSSCGTPCSPMTRTWSSLT